MTKVKTLLSMRIALVLSLALSACSGPGPTNGPPNLLRRGIGGEPSTLDPATAVDTFSLEVLRDLYEGLTTEAANGDVLPGVALAWSVSEDGTEYTFHLRPDAQWSNGTPVKAQDFIRGWRRILDPRSGSPVADNLKLIAGAADILKGRLPPSSLAVFAKADDILIVRLERPAPYFPQVLTHSAAYPIFSEESASTHSGTRWISNGPYVLKQWSPGAQLKLASDDHYWNKKNVHIKNVEYQILTDENSQLARYRAGQIDMTDTVPTNAIEMFRGAKSQELVTAPFLATAYYGFNLSAPPFSGNGKLRKAIAMAIDRKQLVKSLGFGQPPAYGFVPPGTWNYAPQAWEWKDLSDDERIKEARRLYAEAGYSQMNPLRLRILFNANTTVKNTAIMIAAMLRTNLAVDTTLIEEEYRVFLQSRQDKTQWDLVRLGWTADFNDASNFLETFRSSSPNNDSLLIDPNFDRLLDSASVNSDGSKRRLQLEESERLMLADYPIVPLYFFVSKRLVKPYIRGVKANPLNRVASKDLEFVLH